MVKLRPIKLPSSRAWSLELGVLCGTGTGEDGIHLQLPCTAPPIMPLDYPMAIWLASAVCTTINPLLKDEVDCDSIQGQKSGYSEEFGALAWWSLAYLRLEGLERPGFIGAIVGRFVKNDVGLHSGTSSYRYNTKIKFQQSSPICQHQLLVWIAIHLTPLYPSSLQLFPQLVPRLNC